MGDMAEPWRSMRAERQNQVASGKRLSMKYRTEKERDEAVAHSHQLNNQIDNDDLKALKQKGVNAERKSASSFQLTITGGKVMLYTGRKGTFIYLPKLNKKYKVDRWFDNINSVIKDVEKEI